MSTPPPAPESPVPPATRPAATARREALILAAGGVLFLGLLLYSAAWRRHGPLPPVVALLVAAGMTALLRAARVSAASIAVVLGGLGLQLVYLGWTGATHRNLDAAAQLEYINYIVAHHALPSNGTCLVCHHPPLYYLLAAAARRVLEACHVAHVESGLQALSLVLMGVFLLFSVLVIERLAARPGQRVLATALVAFWPYTILNSVRVHNDVGVYPVAAVTLYLLVRWVQDGGRGRLALACGMALLGLAVKANAAILVALVLVLVAYRALVAADRRAVLREAAPVVALLLCVAVAGTLARGERGAGVGARVLGTAYQESPSGPTKRSLRYYLTFSPSAMLATPYAQRRFLGTDSREPTYWNHLVKSSLHGTRNAFATHSEVRESPALARAAIWGLLVLTGFLLLGVLLTARASSPARTVVLLTIGVYVLGGLAFHLVVPIAHHADFRFIYPVLVPMSLLYAQAVADLRGRSFRAWPAWVVVACAFVAVNAAYFVPAVIRHAQPAATAPATPRDATPAPPGRRRLQLPARPPASQPHAAPVSSPAGADGDERPGWKGLREHMRGRLGPRRDGGAGPPR